MLKTSSFTPCLSDLASTFTRFLISLSPISFLTNPKNYFKYISLVLPYSTIASTASALSFFISTSSSSMYSSRSLTIGVIFRSLILERFLRVCLISTMRSFLISSSLSWRAAVMCERIVCSWYWVCLNMVSMVLSAYFLTEGEISLSRLVSTVVVWVM